MTPGDQRTASRRAAAKALWESLEAARPFTGAIRDLPIDAIAEAMLARETKVLEEERERLSWTISPAMAQAQIEQQAQRIKELLGEVVKFAETIVEQYEKNPSHLAYIPLDVQYAHAKQFLARLDVREWQARQKEAP